MPDDAIQSAKDLLKLERRIARADAALTVLRSHRADLVARLSGEKAAP